MPIVGVLEMIGPDVSADEVCTLGQHCTVQVTGLALTMNNRVLVLDVGQPPQPAPF